MRKIIYFITFFLFCCVAYSQNSSFSGKKGLYILGSVDIPLHSDNYERAFVSGAAVRVKWETIEPKPDQYNWSFLDSEIETARRYEKNISISILSAPSWLKDSLGARVYKYIDKNQYHLSYGDTLTGYITWDSIYIARYIKVIKELSDRYNAENVISYFNLIASAFSRNLPDTLYNGSKFYKEFKYNPDTLVSKMKYVLDFYMKYFPNTPLWNSMDYVRFEPEATGKPINYVASEYSKYGIEKYPNRFGVWREDLSACNPSEAISQSSHWFILKQNPLRNGAQMLWSVQDGAVRMNQCNSLPSDKISVMDSALSNGKSLGILYFEIYQNDIEDPSLSAVFEKYSAALTVNKIEERKSNCSDSYSLSQNYPNPFNPATVINYAIPKSTYVLIILYNSIGKNCGVIYKGFQQGGIHTLVLDADKLGLASGVYFYCLLAGETLLYKKMLLMR